MGVERCRLFILSRRIGLFFYSDLWKSVWISKDISESFRNRIPPYSTLTLFSPWLIRFIKDGGGGEKPTPFGSCNWFDHHHLARRRKLIAGTKDSGRAPVHLRSIRLGGEFFLLCYHVSDLDPRSDRTFVHGTINSTKGNQFACLRIFY